MIQWIRPWIGLGFLVGAVAAPYGCRHDAAHDASLDAPRPNTPDADRLFADGRFEDAVAAYSQALESQRDPSEQARLRLFRALALRAHGDRGNERLAFEELRHLEHEHRDTIWGRLARMFVDEMARQEALRDTVIQASARLREVQAQVTELETEVQRSGAANDELRTNLSALKEERTRLSAQVEEAQQRANVQSGRLEALERELSALKQIDMQREP